jgi:lipopolysaccharide/colanic/teichoic acid biosynthesis glycosyltransferase
MTRQAVDVAAERRPRQGAAKRAMDLLLSLAIVVVLSPVLIGLALAVLVADGRPVLFRQPRAGLNGVPFMLYKFRTMRPPPPGTAPAPNPYQWEGRVPDDFMFKSGHNPNVTRVGAFLRKYSLDELPQLFNVLAGDMSLIGPRPEILPIVACYDATQRRRLEVKPGITGWAQVNGRSEIPHGRKIAYDLYYVDNYSFGLDVRIFFRTLAKVVMGKDAI